jgi:hypothetical protein
MRVAMLAVVLAVMAGGTAQGEWVKYYKYKSDGAIYYYNKDKLKNNGEVITVWIKADDGYPGKIDVDCKKFTYKSITNVVNEIAPDSMMDSLTKIICQEKPAAEKSPPLPVK